MAHTTEGIMQPGVKVTDVDGDQIILTAYGDGLIVNATSANLTDRVDVLLTPEDLDAFLDIISENDIEAALIRKQEAR